MMSIAQTIQNKVQTFPAGQLFGYRALPKTISSVSCGTIF
jgi:hypothetical protein